jgi:hypothetical protein
MLLRCRWCRKGLTAFHAPAFRCPLCGGAQWVEVLNLTLADRWRLWRQTGLAPWTTLVPLPE